MIEKIENTTVVTEAFLRCPICGAKGALLYCGLKDRIFSTTGVWNLRRCESANCKIIWLDPIPLEGEAPKAYENYFTHNLVRNSSKRRYQGIPNYIKRGFWAQKYGYFNGGVKFYQKVFSNIVYLFPQKHKYYDIKIMFLPFKKRGLLLDIGSGDGQFLQLMQSLGWDVEGIDLDPFVVESSRKRNLNVHLGGLKSRGYPNDKFDAITMNNLIEHTIDPIGLLNESYKILKPSGRLVIVTPNSLSLCHKIFKQNWRGLEPPRHLCLMNRSVLVKIVHDAGFKIDKLGTTVQSNYILLSSYLLNKEIDIDNRSPLRTGIFINIVANMIVFFQSLLSSVIRDLGEDIYLTAYK